MWKSFKIDHTNSKLLCPYAKLHFDINLSNFWMRQKLTLIIALLYPALKNIMLHGTRFITFPKKRLFNCAIKDNQLLSSFPALVDLFFHFRSLYFLVNYQFRCDCKLNWHAIFLGCVQDATRDLWTWHCSWKSCIRHTT